MNSVETFELKSTDLDTVNGGLLPVIFAASVISLAAGYFAGRNS